MSLSKGFVVVFGNFAEPVVFPNAPAVAFPPPVIALAIFGHKIVFSGQKNRKVDDTVLRI